ncbi:hypothetical protein [Nocardioides sp. SYSU D00038]|uniref:hypothetical protein n=1 Tax=Nocardioides sp. SYSU D00038 TaxID=2812554 RepID=UPI00196825B9|nr:hypothetical protein [Nocardioides sp. SYSU D00038]
MIGLRAHRTRLRTAVAVLAVAGLPLAGLTALAPAAQAAPVENAGFGVGTDVDYNDAECTATNGGDGNGDEQPANGVPVTRTQSTTSTVTSTGDAADVTNLTANVTGRMRMVVTDGNLSEVELSGSGRATATPQKNPSECDAEIEAEIEGGVEFTLTRPTWVVATVSGNKQTAVGVQGGNQKSFMVAAIGAGGQSTASQLFPAGQYYLSLDFGWSSDGSGFYLKQAAAARGAARAEALAAAKAMGEGTGRVHVELRAAGSATGKAFGSGKKYLKPGDAVSCATGKVAATFTKKAKQVEKATFLVNGKKRKTVKNPKKGRTVLLPLPATRSNTVKVKLVVDPPGRRGAVTKTVTRSYRGCGQA